MTTMTTAITNLRKVAANLNARFPKRETAIELMLASLIADEFCILYGPPGTGKSALVEALMKSITADKRKREARRFALGLSRSTPLADIVGDIDIPSWERTGVRSYNTSKHMPSAEVVFLDEIFKGEGAILQGLLRVINERVFDDKPVLLRWLVAASNELPVEFRGMMNGEAQEMHGEESMRAFADRFFYGHEVKPLVKGGAEWAAVIRRTLPKDNGATVDLEEVRELNEAIPSFPWAPAAWEAFTKMAVMLENGFDNGQENRRVEVSDRRWEKAYRVVTAHAMLRGAARVTGADLDWLEHGLWTTPDQQALVKKVILLCAPPAAAEAKAEAEAMTALAAAFIRGNLVNTQGADLEIVTERVDISEPRANSAWIKLNIKMKRKIDSLSKSLLEQDDEDTKEVIRAAVERLHEMHEKCLAAAGAAAKAER